MFTDPAILWFCALLLLNNKIPARTGTKSRHCNLLAMGVNRLYVDAGYLNIIRYAEFCGLNEEWKPEIVSTALNLSCERALTAMQHIAIRTSSCLVEGIAVII